jgi:hypothetical protein
MWQEIVARGRRRPLVAYIGACGPVGVLAYVLKERLMNNNLRRCVEDCIDISAVAFADMFIKRSHVVWCKPSEDFSVFSWRQGHTVLLAPVQSKARTTK